jgi:hypothetical protein
MPKLVLFACSRGIGRALLAASLLQAADPDHWEAWWSADSVDRQAPAIVEQILHEQGRVSLAAERRVVPTSTMAWEDIIILCSGVTDT